MAAPSLSSQNSITPNAANTASITPSSTAWANGAYTELLASASADLLLLELAVTPSGAVTAPIQYEIDLATGAAGSEVVFAALPAQRSNAGGAGVANLVFPFPLRVASGARVAARVRTSSTNTSPFGVALSTVPEASAASLYPTSAAAKCVPTGTTSSVTTSATAWASGAWVELTASLGIDIVVYALAALYHTSGEYEIDIGTGASGSEVVVTTIRDNTGGSNGGDPNFLTMHAPLRITSGTRIAARARGSVASAVSVSVKLAYYETPLGADVPADATTTKGTEITPAAAGAISVTSGATADSWGAWVEFIASAGADLALSGVIPFAFNSEVQVQVGVGSAGAEAPIATLFVGGGSSGRHRQWNPLPIPLTGRMASGTRVALRTRGFHPTATYSFALATIANYDGGTSTDKLPAVAPDTADRVDITVNATAWANSAWVELTSGLANPAAIYGLSFQGSGVAAQFEMDLATGAAGSEVVFHTIRNYTSFNAVTNHMLGCVLPLVASTRVAVRLRKSGTSTQLWSASLLYFDNLDLAGGGGGGTFNALLIAP